MYGITDEMIRGGCTHAETYMRGLKYYREGRVDDVEVDSEFGYVEAVVAGSEDYFVTLSLSRDGHVESAECQCAAYQEYTGFCKHIVALLLYLKNQDSSRTDRVQQDVIDFKKVKASGDIVRFFEEKLSTVTKEPVELEVTLEVTYHGVYEREIKPSVSLRMGSKKLYVVKSITELMESMENSYPMEFNKNFTFEPSEQCFKDEDLPLMEFIREMYEIDSSIKDYSRGSYGFRNSSAGSLFTGKYLNLPPATMERFLGIMKGRPLKAVVMGKPYDDVSIVEEDLPVDFLLKKSGDSLILNVNVPEKVIPFTLDGRYMFLDGTIYRISKAQSENLVPFFNTIAQTGSRDIKFTQKDREKVASLVLPSIKKAGKLSVDGSIEELFYQRPLEARIYLDKSGDRITAGFSFVYGDYTIDPFGEKEQPGDKNIIVRDYEKERKILAVFEHSGFKVNKEQIYLEDDDAVYSFITEYIPVLQELCEIYYSESFKKIKIYDSSYYRSSVRYNEDSDLLEFSFAIDGIDRESLPNIFASLKQKRRYYRLADGSYLPLDSDKLDTISNMMEYLDLDENDLKKELINLPKFKALYLDEQLEELESVHTKRNLAFKTLVDNIKEPKDTDYEVPRELAGILREYQVTGFKWLKTLSSYGLGGILADDMGLGKTLQTIAFIQSEKEKLRLPSIVVCPTSLVYNWQSEVEKFDPSLKTLIVSGNRGEREELVKQISDADIVITSYPLIRRDIENYSEITFAYCILDEAQHIKNPNSINAKSVKEIKAKGYFALTGTPIENNLTELWSIFDFLMPGFLLSHRKFVEKFEKPIAGRDGQEALKELNRHVKPFILRRMKKDVLKELPPKIESILTAELTEEQKKLYLAYLQQIKGKIEEEIREKGFEKSQIQILAGLTRLRQICCHPSLFIENYAGDSGKMDMLLELMQELLEGGHRVLLFSQFTGALKLIRERLEKESMSYFYLDGSTKAEVRTELVKSFNQGFREIFLISLKAGGTGLNLTGADTVIHFDPWWNPAVEEQATDRAYRIGQQSSVQVMKLITKGTIEEKIYALQQKKRELIGAVLQPGETFISKMTEQDIKDLFQIS